MDEAFVNACKKLVVFGSAAGFSRYGMLGRWLNGMTGDQLLGL